MSTEATERYEPTAEERRNGWTTESLNAYLAERRAETAEFAKLEAEATHKVRLARAETTRNFNPHDWLA